MPNLTSKHFKCIEEFSVSFCCISENLLQVCFVVLACMTFSCCTHVCSTKWEIPNYSCLPWLSDLFINFRCKDKHHLLQLEAVPNTLLAVGMMVRREMIRRKQEMMLWISCQELISGMLLPRTDIRLAVLRTYFLSACLDMQLICKVFINTVYIICIYCKLTINL